MNTNVIEVTPKFISDFCAAIEAAYEIAPLIAELEGIKHDYGYDGKYSEVVSVDEWEIEVRCRWMTGCCGQYDTHEETTRVPWTRIQAWLRNPSHAAKQLHLEVKKAADARAEAEQLRKQQIEVAQKERIRAAEITTLRALREKYPDVR